MNFIKYLEDVKAQKLLNKAAKKYKGKKIAIYGAGKFSDVLFSKYDLSQLNIVAIADRKFIGEERKFYSYNCITPDELKEYDCDVILIANYNFMFFWDFLEKNLLRETKNEYVPVKPLLELSFIEYAKSLIAQFKYL